MAEVEFLAIVLGERLGIDADQAGNVWFANTIASERLDRAPIGKPGYVTLAGHDQGSGWSTSLAISPAPLSPGIAISRRFGHERAIAGPRVPSAAASSGTASCSRFCV
jgi:hypothetical protein